MVAEEVRFPSGILRPEAVRLQYRMFTYLRITLSEIVCHEIPVLIAGWRR